MVSTWWIMTSHVHPEARVDYIAEAEHNQVTKPKQIANMSQYSKGVLKEKVSEKFIDLICLLVVLGLGLPNL